MSLLDSIPLPQVVKRVQPPEQEKKDAPPEAMQEKKQFDLELEDEKEDLDKRFIIVCSRDLSSADEDIFRQHGKVLRWKKESFLNLPFEQLDFDFLVIDAREREARLTLKRQDLKKYNLVAYVYAIQKGVDDMLNEIDTVVDISSIPQFAINGRDFRHQLMTQKLSAPSVTKSFLRFALRCLFG